MTERQFTHYVGDACPGGHQDDKEANRAYSQDAIGSAGLERLLRDVFPLTSGTQTMEPNCTCGHGSIEHIYGEGACRPGFVCECPKFVKAGMRPIGGSRADSPILPTRCDHHMSIRMDRPRCEGCGVYLRTLLDQLGEAQVEIAEMLDGLTQYAHRGEYDFSLLIEQLKRVRNVLEDRQAMENEERRYSPSAGEISRLNQR